MLVPLAVWNDLANWLAIHEMIVYTQAYRPEKYLHMWVNLVVAGGFPKKRKRKRKTRKRTRKKKTKTKTKKEKTKNHNK